MVAVNVNEIFAYLRELESKYPINGLQSEDDLQEKIDELEIKLMRSNAVKEELEKQIEDQNKLFRIHIGEDVILTYTIDVIFFIIIIIF